MSAQTIDDLLQKARASLDRLDPAIARDEVAAGALIIDTRCAEARHESGVIPASVHVPLSVLYWRLDPTSGHNDPSLSDRERRIILVCADGSSSSLAAATLRDLGSGQPTSTGASTPGSRRVSQSRSVFEDAQSKPRLESTRRRTPRCRRNSNGHAGVVEDGGLRDRLM